ncbi:MAG: hypothetical protein JXR03_02795 [Cyclobacteriaceae bacterium]
MNHGIFEITEAEIKQLREDGINIPNNSSVRGMLNEIYVGEDSFRKSISKNIGKSLTPEEVDKILLICQIKNPISYYLKEAELKKSVAELKSKRWEFFGKLSTIIGGIIIGGLGLATGVNNYLKAEKVKIELSEKEAELSEKERELDEKTIMINQSEDEIENQKKVISLLGDSIERAQSLYNFYNTKGKSKQQKVNDLQSEIRSLESIIKELNIEREDKSVENRTYRNNEQAWKKEYEKLVENCQVDEQKVEVSIETKFKEKKKQRNYYRVIIKILAEEEELEKIESVSYMFTDGLSNRTGLINSNEHFLYPVSAYRAFTVTSVILFKDGSVSTKFSNVSIPPKS